MARVHRGRYSAQVGEDGVVVFLIGMRINRLWQVWRWFPVAIAMPRMLRELRRDPSLGLLAPPRAFVSGRVLQVQQYWRSFEALESYARSAQNDHLPAWRAFNRRIRDNGSVGIYHETYTIGAGQYEAMYVNMPAFGLGTAFEPVPARSVGDTAAARIGARVHDEPAVPSY